MADLGGFQPRSGSADEVPAIGFDVTDPFFIRFPGVAPGAAPQASHIEHLKEDIRGKAKSVIDNANSIRGYFECGGGVPLVPVSPGEIDAVITAAQDLMNDLAVCAGGAEYGYSDGLAHPDPSLAARDLVDLELIGTIDRLLLVTGVNDRLGASGVWWWQYREDFWRALEEVIPATSTTPINAAEVVKIARSQHGPLTTPQIARLTTRYRLEYARYEAAARSVEDRLRKMLGAARVKALIASRAKDSDSLRKKLDRKSSKYEFVGLDADLGSVVTDLAGVRVILYDDQDTDRVVALIKDTWKGCTDESHNAQYKARHLTVVLSEPDGRSIDGARCEIQLTSLSDHAFNELEHDITYKDQDVSAGPEVLERLEMLRHSTAALQLVIRQLHAARKAELDAGKSEITNGMDLGAVLDAVFRRRVTGDFDAVLHLWLGDEQQPLTRQLVMQRAPVLLRRGRSLVDGGADDATAIALALFSGSLGELRHVAGSYPNQDSPVIRAILDRSTRENP